jgi:hypothetical protein
MSGDTSVSTSDTSTNTNQPLSDDNLIGESLLSLAKDARYIQQCQNLLLQVIEPMMARHDSQSRLDLQKITLFLSYVLYTLLVVAPTGRTLGMEVCGLRFTGETTKRRHLAGSLLAVTVGAFALDRLTTRNNTNDTTANREALRGGDRRRMHDILRRQMLQRAASQSTSTSSPPSTSTSTAQRSSHLEQRRQTQPLRSFRERALSVVRLISKVGPFKMMVLSSSRLVSPPCLF